MKILENQSVEPEVLAVIRRRRSCRVYSGKPLTEAQMVELRQLASDMETPFGGEVHIQILSNGDSPFVRLGNSATYGVISNAPAFCTAVITPEKKRLVDCGFALESMVLRSSSMGLSTCWQGCSFSKKTFAKALGLSEGEVVASVVAIGEGLPRRSLRDRTMELVFGTSKRKPWEHIFFDEAMGRPLEQNSVDPRAILALEALRLAPSAMNAQEWRVVRTCGGKRFELFVTPLGSLSALGKGTGVDFRFVDAGIAMCHFQQVARHTGFPGSWTADEAPLAALQGKMEFVAVWR